MSPDAQLRSAFQIQGVRPHRRRPEFQNNRDMTATQVSIDPELQEILFNALDRRATHNSSEYRVSNSIRIGVYTLATRWRYVVCAK